MSGCNDLCFQMTGSGGLLNGTIEYFVDMWKR